MYFNILFLFQKTGRVLPLAKKYSRLLTYKFVYQDSGGGPTYKEGTPELPVL